VTTKKPETYSATYVGGVDGVVVTLPSGRSLTFERGESHTIMASEHPALANHPEFKLAAEKAKEESK
jgi:hypothetical protein